MLKQYEKNITCPYCGESIDVLIDGSGGSQDYYEDCSVCCAPILFIVSVDEYNQSLTIEVRRDDD